MHIIRCAFLGVFLMLGAAVYGQDPILSQFYSAPTLINPGFTGTSGAPRIALNHRRQWPNLISGVAYETTAASYEQFFEPMNSGIGLNVLSDNLGDGSFRTTRFMLNYAYRVSVNDDFHIKLGIEAGGQHIGVDWDRFTFFDQIDRAYGFVNEFGAPNQTNELRPDVESKTVFDIGAGLVAYSSKFYGGIGVSHLNSPDLSILDNNPNLNTALPLRMTIIAGTEIELVEGNRTRRGAFISPNLLFVNQGNQGQVTGGAYLSYGGIFGGAWYRYAFGNQDAVIGMLGYQFDVFKLGYSFDYTTSQFSFGNTGGAHEISVVVNFAESDAYKKSKRDSRNNDCFGLFR